MTLFRFCHAQENSFAFFIVLSFREIAVRLRCLNFCLPVAPCSIDRLSVVFLLSGHAALKRKERRFPNRPVGFWERTLPACCEEHLALRTPGVLCWRIVFGRMPNT